MVEQDSLTQYDKFSSQNLSSNSFWATDCDSTAGIVFTFIKFFVYGSFFIRILIYE